MDPENATITEAKRDASLAGEDTESTTQECDNYSCLEAGTEDETGK